MKIRVAIEIQDENGNIVYSEPVRISEIVTGKKLIEALRSELFSILGDNEYIALVEWNNQKPQDNFLSEDSKVILKRTSSKDLVRYDDNRMVGSKNSRLAGDSITDAPLTKKKKKQ